MYLLQNLKTNSLYLYNNPTNFDHAACISVVSSCAMSNFFLVVIQCNGGWRPNLQLTDRVETLWASRNWDPWRRNAAALGLRGGRRQLPPVGLRKALSAHEKGRAGQIISTTGRAGMGGGRPGKNIFGTTMWSETLHCTMCSLYSFFFSLDRMQWDIS